MKPVQLRSIPPALLLILTLGSTANAASILINGSFEEPNVPTGTFAVFPSIPGWVSTMGDMLIEVQDHVAGAPFDGAQHVELDVFNNSNMVQSVSTVGGQAYSLSFAYSPRPLVSASSNPIDVFFDGALIASLTGVGSTQTVWQVFNFITTASGTSAALEFRAGGTSDSFGGYLDAVSLEPLSTPSPVPEPSTLVMLATGLIGAGVRRYRSRG